MIKNIIMVLILLFVISGCNSRDSVDDNGSIDKNISTKKETNQKARVVKEITFTLESVNGETLHIKEIDNGLEFKEFKGKPLFLILFGYRCPPCLAEIPTLIELKKEYKDLEIVAIEVQGLDPDELKAFSEDRGINYTVIPGYNNMDFISYIQVKASWSGSIPFLLGLNREGRVKIMQVGGIPESQFKIGYQELIKP